MEGEVSRMRLRVICVVLLALALIHAPTAAISVDTARGIRVASNITEPIAARDGVLFLPLDAERHGTDWPQTIDVRFGQGGLVRGEVVWIEARGRGGNEVHWTSPPVGLMVRPIEAADDSRASQLPPHVVVDIPINASGTIEILGRTIAPVWMETKLQPVPSIERAGGMPVPPKGTLERAQGHHLPDADSPFEYWRWMVIASRKNMHPPEPRGDRIEQMVATYYADLWRIGLGRLADQSAGIARQVRDLLSETVHDNRTEIAAWITDADELSYILSLMLDFSKSDQAMARDALAWADTRDLLFFYALDEFDNGDERIVPENPDQQQSAVRLAIANPSVRARLVRLQWAFADPTRNAAEVPLAVELLPGMMSEVRIERSSGEDSSEGLEAITRLRIESDRFEKTIALRAESIAARPPGVVFGPFLSRLTLAEARNFSNVPVDPQFATAATLQRIGYRWEIVAECRRSLAASDMEGGRESLTISLNTLGGDGRTIVIPEEGQIIWLRGNGSDPELYRSSFADRWYVRVVLPEEWLGAGEIELGFVRAHAGVAAIHSSPAAMLPWSDEVPHVRIQTSGWSDLPDGRSR
ncbi:MAG: hypothetical protein ACR2GY_04995 [Phycisphaerales bacterium]